ncbi:SRPBCC domain-containing protein [Devosia sp. ZB163]|uniref:SRPBCC domain-containing protein n=1 Tax=Devosia sp. ZB163 TaxID=3025938 RepID=UPI00235FC0BE|nr:SRPBCC domain-containing protein [Devosia sp. ZB163]MDC9823383.1 SRPBCC domain-containing protein [Devosia sp. ZB163]
MLSDLTTVPNDRRLEIEREFDAPRDLVWRMFADPFHLSQWWGPKGFTNPVVELDLRPGGRWHHVMRGPDGREYPTDSEFIEVTPPERIVYRNAAATDQVFGDNPPPSFLRVITLSDIGSGRTRLTLDAYFDTAADKDAVVRRGFREGVLESFDKLAAHLTTGATR